MAGWTDVLSLLSSVVVLVGGIYALLEYSIRRWWRRRRLINPLKLESEKAANQGQRTIVQLMRDLRMTEQQVMDAGFGSARIQPRVTIDPTTHHAREILFEYVPRSHRN